MKPWYESKTIWANIIVTVTAFLTAIYQFLPGLQGTIEPSTYVALLFITGVGNVFLRTITNAGITK